MQTLWNRDCSEWSCQIMRTLHLLMWSLAEKSSLIREIACISAFTGHYLHVTVGFLMQTSYCYFFGETIRRRARTTSPIATYDCIPNHASTNCVLFGPNASLRTWLKRKAAHATWDQSQRCHDEAIDSTTASIDPPQKTQRKEKKEKETGSDSPQHEHDCTRANAAYSADLSKSHSQTLALQTATYVHAGSTQDGKAGRQVPISTGSNNLSANTETHMDPRRLESSTMPWC